MNNPDKQNDIMRWHTENEHTISILTETRINNNTATFWKKRFPEQVIFHTDNSQDINGSGVAIVINRDLASHIYQISEISGRCISIILRFRRGVSVAVSGIYNKGNGD